MDDWLKPARRHIFGTRAHRGNRRRRHRRHGRAHARRLRGGQFDPVAGRRQWTVLVVMMLADGPMRFNELKRKIGGVSQRMLTLTLRGLERDGFVSRTMYPTIPPRVDYELTALGHSLRGPVQELGHWAFEILAVVANARAAFDARGDGE